MYSRQNGLESVGKGDGEGASVNVDFGNCVLYASCAPSCRYKATRPPKVSSHSVSAARIVLLAHLLDVSIHLYHFFALYLNPRLRKRIMAPVYWVWHFVWMKYDEVAVVLCKAG